MIGQGAAVGPASSQAAAVAAAVVGGPGLPGFGGSQDLNGHAFDGLPLTSHPSDEAAAAANNQQYAADTSAMRAQHNANGDPSSSGSSPPEDTSYLGDTGGYMGSRQWAGGPDSSASSSGGQQQNWQPPNYRRTGLRLRSKRQLKAAEQLQQSGGNLIADLQTALSTSSSTGGAGSDAAAEGDHDEHLEAFIEQMLCPKTSTWKGAAGPAAAGVDGREAIDAELLANIHTVPLEQVQQQQAKLVAGKQLLAALVLLEEAAAAGRRDVMRYTQRKPFLRAAGRCAGVLNSRLSVRKGSPKQQVVSTWVTFFAFSQQLHGMLLFPA